MVVLLRKANILSMIKEKLKSITPILFLLSLVSLILTCTPKTSSDANESTLDGIRSRNVLRVATSSGYFPFEMIDREGNVIGFDIDIAKEIAKELEVEFQIKDYGSFGSVIPAVQTGDVDLIIAGMTATPERAEVIGFSQPYFESGQVMMVNKERAPGIAIWRELDTPNREIGVALGTTGEITAQKTFKNAQLRSYEGISLAYLDCVNGKVDAVVFDKPGVLVYTRLHPQKIYPVLDPLTTEELCLGFKYGDAKFKECLDEFLEQFRKSERYQELYDYWFVDMPWREHVETIP